MRISFHNTAAKVQKKSHIRVYAGFFCNLLLDYLWVSTSGRAILFSFFATNSLAV